MCPTSRHSGFNSSFQRSMADWNQSDMLAYADDVVQGRLPPHLHQKRVLLGAERQDDEYVAKYFEKYGG